MSLNGWSTTTNKEGLTKARAQSILVFVLLWLTLERILILMMTGQSEKLLCALFAIHEFMIHPYQTYNSTTLIPMDHSKHPPSDA